ncbi:hypothetical protein BDV27DRAFT_48748 [Aspergillus caelatus]|uniref:Uncharacterized protein n=2 Tax=Aspergillus subgen. Circumdati TaxID=2720871 RepID=A0A5N7AF39_9EURO|nr:uncharacterized protein BDV27DRAFT_48748 [Aspergillus caelatus]KAE8368335.1 hypothetical protein BDV27DRAFT_48748 [Aspergillus caelatus]KAE8416668.1 hypothetical protein BDV36DRAFT_296829 [Aspergillus pseudocaelatus]
MHPNLTSTPGLSLHTSFQPPQDRVCSDGYSTASPLSSTTNSPTSSPTSPFRRFNRGYHPTSGSRSDASDAGSRSQSPFRLSSVFRRPSLVFLRHRPSKVDLALSEERTRCDEDAIERQGLDLMEPRPVDPVGIPMDLNANIFSSVAGDRSSGQSQASQVSQPRFVMGGIFEVMEGRA